MGGVIALSLGDGIGDADHHVAQVGIKDLLAVPHALVQEQNANLEHVFGSALDAVAAGADALGALLPGKVGKVQLGEALAM